jgi:hypothetical protein
MGPEFKVGDEVDKANGYRFPGTVMAVFRNQSGDWRYVVEMDKFHLLHIFNGSQLRKVINGEG